MNVSTYLLEQQEGPGQGHSFNSNVNGSNDDVYYPLLKQPTHMILLYSLAYSLVFVAALVGNFMVMAVVASNPTMHIVTNYFLLNLAVADVLVALFCVPVNLIMNLYNDNLYALSISLMDLG
nr:hypothetical protein BaRGS_000359 [Batillaria attramentaria]